MNPRIKKHLYRLTLLFAFGLCMSASTALAAKATYADVNGVTINSVSPYWKNGGGGSETEWNAFFDTSTAVPTLWLKDAVINTLSSYDELIYADGDLALVLLGSNTLSYTGSAADEVAGIAVEGDLTIRDGTGNGTGSVEILFDKSAPYLYNCGITTYNSLTIESGTIDIFIKLAIFADGIMPEVGENLYINGGKITVVAEGFSVFGVSTDLFSMTDGEISVTVSSVDTETCAMEFVSAVVTGGYGSFVCEDGGFAGVWVWPEGGVFRVLDGRLVFSAADEALYFDTDEIFTPYVTDRILASTDSSGAGKFVWDSSKGILAGNSLEYTDFNYVELIGNGIIDPETGDNSRPWLWIGIGLAAACMGIGACMLLMRKQHA